MRRQHLVITAVATVIVLASIGPQLASSAPRQDPRAEREQVRAEKAQVAAQLDTSKATKSQVDGALQTLDENVQTQQAALSRTEDEVAQAEKDIAEAEAAAKRLTKQIVLLRDEMRVRAVRAYVSPPGTDVLTVLDTKDFTTASSRKFFIELRSQDDADVADRLDGAKTDLQYQRRKATQAKARASRKRAEQARRTDAVKKARNQQASLADELQSTISTQIGRSIELAKTDRKLSAQIAKEQAQRQAQLLAIRAAQAEQAKERLAQAQAAAAAAKRAAAARQSAALQQAARDAEAEAAAAQQAATQQAATPVAQPTQSSSGGASSSPQSPNGGESRPLPPVSSGSSGTGTGGIPLCTVGGITVNCAIQSQLSAMLNAAAADGVRLSGGGYRDPSSQIQLRREHCGSSYYAIYQMPSSSCHPPTAIPGSSQHELGLAIDFSSCSRSSACYGWLSRNASSYGFYNLPSEFVALEHVRPLRPPASGPERHRSSTPTGFGPVEAVALGSAVRAGRSSVGQSAALWSRMSGVRIPSFSPMAVGRSPSMAAGRRRPRKRNRLASARKGSTRVASRL